MKTKLNDLEIPVKEPFANCKLHRINEANVLSKIIAESEGGFTLAVNGRWGSGKTTFMKMWQQKLQNDGYHTIYFNAWENDFDSEPLIPILGELYGIYKEDNVKKKFAELIEKGRKIIRKKFVPTMIKSLIEMRLGNEAKLLYDEILSSTDKFFESEIEDYSTKKNELIEFKNSLSEVIRSEFSPAEGSTSPKPLIFIVDELDRCRPDYAVQVLEKIKHFFSINEIIFVLAIDKTQLCSSILGYYGSEKIDAEEYLRRFIDIDYKLAEFSVKYYCEDLCKYFDLDQYFVADGTGRFGVEGDKETFMKIAVWLAKIEKLTLRQIEKLFAYTKAISQINSSEIQGNLPHYFFMAYIRSFHIDLYNGMKNSTLDIKVLIDNLDKIFSEIGEEDKNLEGFSLLRYIFSLLVFFYASKREESLTTHNKITNTDVFVFESNFFNIPDSLIKKIAEYNPDRFFNKLIKATDLESFTQEL